MATKTTKKAAPAAKVTAPAKSAAPVKKAAATKSTDTPAKVSAKAPAKPTTPATPKTAVKAAAPAPKAASQKQPAPAAEKSAPAKPHKWDEIREQLLQLKEATLREISRSIKSGSEAKVGEETTGDIYDQASSERDRELELILSDRERQKVHNIDDALLRMKEGEYGICEECDEEIPLGRLKAMPFTRHCVKCKSDLERLQAQTRRFEEDRAYREIPLGDEEEA
ncbi:MAG: TraR/DksA C4-type zinc finger protein [Geobacter sp.]